ncbi:CidA/LrgA family protein [Aliiglaciecola sp. SL4]|uniref:CidA/LrgA family protein n=1 Tax=Aliiglaciecola sp. SL4 TaxID=3239806 RepID=UPI00355C1CB5
MLRTIIKISFSIAIIFSFLWTGITIQTLSGIPLPGSIIGMLLLFLCLSAGIIPTRLMEDGAKLMLRHMLLFFIPIAVGFMNYFDLMYQQMALFLAGTILSNIVVAVILSLVFKQLKAKEQQ